MKSVKCGKCKGHEQTAGKRVLSLLLVTAMLFLCFPAAVFADSALSLYIDGAKASELQIVEGEKKKVTAGEEELAYYQWQIFSWTEDKYVDIMGKTGRTLTVTSSLAYSAMNGSGECRIRCMAGSSEDEHAFSNALSVTVVPKTEPEEAPSDNTAATEPTTAPTESSTTEATTAPTETNPTEAATDPTEAEVTEGTTAPTGATEAEETKAATDPTEAAADPAEAEAAQTGETQPDETQDVTLTADALMLPDLSDIHLRAEAKAPLREAGADEWSVTVRFLYQSQAPDSNETAAYTRRDTVKQGAAYNAQVDFPVIPGYAAYWIEDSSRYEAANNAWNVASLTASTSHTIQSESVAGNLTYYVVYVQQTANYTIKRMKQNVSGDGYTYFDTVTASGNIGATITTVNADPIEGFTLNSITHDVVIAADGSAEVVAYYDRNTHNISFDLNGGNIDGSTSTVSQSGRYGSTVSVVNPKKDYKDFDGWTVTTTPDTTEEVKAAIAAEAATGSVTVRDYDITLTAKWKSVTTYYTIEYYLDDADTGVFSDPNPWITETVNDVEAGTTVNILENGNPTFADSTMANYVTYNSFDGNSVQTIAADGSTVFKLKYKRKTYTIKFNIKGTLSSTSLSQSPKLTKPPTTSPVYTNTYSISDVRYGENIEDRWPTRAWVTKNPQEKHRIPLSNYTNTKTYYFNGIKLSNKVLTCNPRRLTSAIIGDGKSSSYTFDVSWILGNDTAFVLDIISYIAGDLAVEYEVRCQFQSLTNTSTYENQKTEKVYVLKEGDIVPPDFDGFETPSSPNRSGADYVIYRYNRKKYKFNTVDNGTIHSTKSVAYEATISKPANLSDTNDYRFIGWCSDSELKNLITDEEWSNMKMPAHDMYVYAKWEPIVHYTVKVYNTSDFSETPIATHTNIAVGGTVATAPATPTRDGYTFNKWVYMENGVEKDFTFGSSGTQVNANLNVYAKWNPQSFESYTVKQIDRVTGRVLSTTPNYSNPKYGESIQVDAPAAPSGYTLVSSASITKVITRNGEEFVFEYDPTNEPITVKYIAVVDGGTTDLHGNMLSLDWYVGLPASVAASTATAAEGYTFEGWFTDRACREQVESSSLSGDGATIQPTGLTDDTNYYAKFSSVNATGTITITNNGADGIFTVSQSGTPVVNVAVCQGGSVTVKVTTGEYTVSSGQNWNYLYDHTNAQSVTVGAGDAPTVTFRNVQETPKYNWLCGEARKAS